MEHRNEGMTLRNNRAAARARPRIPVALALLAAVALVSCKSTEQEPLPPAAEEPAVEEPAELGFRYADPGIKIECEHMQLEGCTVTEDPSASGGACVSLATKAASAECRVMLPPGDYECLAAEKAFDNRHATFHLYIDGKASRLYPSNPPLGIWELTTRTPVLLSVEEERTVTVTLKSDGPEKEGQTGMAIDYIQFVRQ